jgi:hypothetical protein
MCHEPFAPRKFTRFHKQNFEDMMFENENKVEKEKLNDPKPCSRDWLAHHEADVRMHGMEKDKILGWALWNCSRANLVHESQDLVIFLWPLANKILLSLGHEKGKTLHCHPWCLMEIITLGFRQGGVK